MFFIIILAFLYFILNYFKKENFTEPMLNIYNEPLKECGTPSMTNGSWDSNRKCSELTGGVHQICIKNIAKNTKNFSKQTGQSNWSDKRGNNNHCVCLGAWSLYNTQNKPENVLKCDAIPKASLSINYVSKFSEGWNKWNGLELKDQIKNGVEALFKNCYNTKNIKKSKNLKKNYCTFAKKVDILKKSNLYKNICL